MQRIQHIGGYQTGTLYGYKDDDGTVTTGWAIVEWDSRPIPWDHYLVSPDKIMPLDDEPLPFEFEVDDPHSPPLK